MENEVPQESTASKLGKGLLTGLAYGALIGIGVSLLPGVALVGGPATAVVNTISGIGTALGLKAIAFGAGGAVAQASVATLVGLTAAIGAAIGALSGVTKEYSPNRVANVELEKTKMQTAALGAIVQEQQRAIETMVEQSSPQTLAGQPIVRGAHCQAEEMRRASASMSGPTV